MKLIILLAQLLAITACAPARYHESGKRFNAYLMSFLNEAEMRGKYPDISNIKFKYENIDDLIRDGTKYATLGLCFKHKQEIVINKRMWLLATKEAREITIFHELGHCALNKGHVEGSKDIMSSRLLSTVYYRKNRTQVLNRFFESEVLTNSK